MLRIDFLFLDLTTCTRCRGTDRSLESALESVHDGLAAAGTEVEVNKIHVSSAAQARELRLVSSPTIRINDRDVALELRESACGGETCAGCGESIDCRVWVHRGREYTEPPVEMIVEAIQRELAEPAAAPHESEAPYQLPANLARFFADRREQPEPSSCCSSDEQAACCEPEDKAACCGDTAGAGCGCR